MTRTLIVGVDPGVTTGVCALAFPPGVTSRPDGGLRADGPIVLECEARDAVDLIDDILTEHGRLQRCRLVVAVEQFVVSQRAADSDTSEAGRITRELLDHLGCLADGVRVRSASTVKPWATDKRLRAAGLYASTEGRTHARNAARHALFEAVYSKVASNPGRVYGPR